jgi:putative membrane protein
MKRHRPNIEPIQPDAFIASATMTCMAEVQLAQLALAQETSDSIRSFATRLVEDCERTLLEISRIATRKNLPVPRTLDQEHENILQRVRGKQGPDFHAVYMDGIALHQRHAINLYKRGQTIKIPEISALASRMLAMAEARRMAQDQEPV